MTLKVKDILEHGKKTPPPSGHQNKGAAIATSLQLIHRFRSGYTQRDVRPLDASAFLVSKPWNYLYMNFYVPNRDRSSVWQKKSRQLPYNADSLHSGPGALFMMKESRKRNVWGRRLNEHLIAVHRHRPLNFASSSRLD